MRIFGFACAAVVRALSVPGVLVSAQPLSCSFLAAVAVAFFLPSFFHPASSVEVVVSFSIRARPFAGFPVPVCRKDLFAMHSCKLRCFLRVSFAWKELRLYYNMLLPATTHRLCRRSVHRIV